MTLRERMREALDNPIVAGVVTGLLIASAFALLAVFTATLWPLWAWMAHPWP
jgi:hypothetical protein